MLAPTGVPQITLPPTQTTLSCRDPPNYSHSPPLHCHPRLRVPQTTLRFRQPTGAPQTPPLTHRGPCGGRTSLTLNSTGLGAKITEPWTGNRLFLFFLYSVSKREEKQRIKTDRMTDTQRKPFLHKHLRQSCRGSWGRDPRE